jgi:hypothetical protein
MTESERELKARDFVDSILEVNRQHGVEMSSAEIEYDVAVKEAVATFRHLPDGPPQVPGSEIDGHAATCH